MVMATDNGKVHTIAVGNTRSNWAGYRLDHRLAEIQHVETKY